MARFEIKSKEGDLIRYSGKPRYNGSYLRPSYLEFSEIASPTPIAWEVGDYVDYPRTGMRYRLYSLPQPTKNARKGASGKAFTYSSVQLYAATKELEIALFKDLVTADNNIHFSTSPDVATFEDVYGIARRIQACMDYFYPERWEIKVADFDEIEDAEVLEKIRTAKDFAVSGGTCLDALSKIYELWQDIGWIHTYEDGKEVITIGYANKRIGVNTTESFLYGKGNGLTAIKKNQSNKEEFATRLYVYGSERNLPARYYNEKNILNAESVDIRHLMLPLDRWGTTDGLPDARKAYLEDADAVAKYGLVPKTHYFDSEEAGADIYPSIGGMTIGRLRKVLQDVGQTEYVPRLDIYPNDTERVDKVVVTTTPSDNGVLKKNGNEHDITLSQYYIEKTNGGIEISGKAGEEVILLDKYPIVEYNIPSEGIYRAKVSMKIDRNCEVLDKGYSSVYAVLSLSNGSNGSINKTKKLVGIKDGDQWNINISAISADYDDASYLKYSINLNITVYAELGSDVDHNASVTITEGYITTTLDRIFDKTFNITLKQIGFDIDKKATEGSGKTISLKTGACAGRDFEIVESTYASSSDTWTIRCKRQQDDTLGMLFPNTDYRISKDDEFVLVSIAMPETYVLVAQERLLEDGLKLLAKASKAQYHYEPSIDAKVMVESARSIREGMFMEITDEDVVDNTTDYILIDTLSIYEDESAIPTYKVTLRERRKVTYKGTPSATSANDTKSVGGDETIEVDLTGYATETYVNEKIAAVDVSDQLKDYATKKDVDDRFEQLIGEAPEALDTLKEIADALKEDDDVAAGIIKEVGIVKGQVALHTNAIASLGEKNTEQDTAIGQIQQKDEEQDNDINGIKTRLDAAEKITSLFGEDEKGVYLKNSKNFYTRGEISAGGAASEGGGEGGDVVVGGSLDSLEDVDINEIEIDSTLSAAEKEAVTESQVLSYDSKGVWVNKTTMYIHRQQESAKVWEITHNMNKMPNVKVIDAYGELVFGTIKYDLNNLNRLEIHFGGAFSGRAYLD